MCDRGVAERARLHLELTVRRGTAIVETLEWSAGGGVHSPAA